MNLHERKCHDCGNVAQHEDNVVPWVLCSKCGSQDTRRTKRPEPAPTIDDLAMLVRRLVRQVQKHETENAVVIQAMDYLNRKALITGSLLREET